jgi:uncharacterized repeat protein (TIGR01451 family)
MSKPYFFLFKTNLIFSLGFLFLIFTSKPLFSQCGAPYVMDYDKRGEAYITTGDPFGSPTNPLPWDLSQGRWTSCKRESKYFKDNQYPAYYSPTPNFSNLYYEIQAGHHLEVGTWRLGNSITLVVCGFLKIGNFEPPPLEVYINKKAIALDGQPLAQVTFSEIGQVITYQIEVVNLMNISVTNLTVSDPKTNFSYNHTSPFEPGETLTLTTYYTITSEDIGKGYIENEAIVEGEGEIGGEISNQASEIVYGPLSLLKTANIQFYSNIGDQISYDISVTNNSPTPIHLTSLIDSDLQINLSFSEGELILGPGDSYVLENQGPYSITEDDLNDGFFTNTAIASGLMDKIPIGAEGSATAFFQPLSVTKVADQTAYSSIGDIINYTITVKNLSEVTVNNVQVSDPLTGLNTNIGSLAPGASWVGNVSYSITSDDLENPFLENIARAWGTTTSGYAFALSEGSYTVNNTSLKNLVSFGEEESGGIEALGNKADPESNTFFNQINLIICEGGVLIAEDIQAMNNVNIYNNGTFVFEHIDGQQANLCIQGEGTYLDHDLNPIISVDENGNYIVEQPDDITDLDNWYTGPACDIPLPIDLLAFNSKVRPDRVELNWTTGTEINNDYFTIERSRDLYGWEVMGFVEGAGNSSVPLSYSYSDLRPLDGVGYYRLKQTDFDGKYEYFGPIAAHYDLGLEGLDFKVMKQYTNWVIAVPNDGVYQVEVYNLQGHRLHSERVENNLSIPAPQGAVVIRVTDGFERSASRVVM